LKPPTGGVVDEVVDIIPARYNTNSILKVDIQADGAAKDFHLATEATGR
jgi:hypothetical protein